jgi:hypothetical protein
MNRTNTLKASFDEDGNEPEYSVEEKPNIYKFTVQLQIPIEPNEELTIKTVEKQKNLSASRRDVCLFKNTLFFLIDNFLTKKRKNQIIKTNH